MMSSSRQFDMPHVILLFTVLFAVVGPTCSHEPGDGHRHGHGIDHQVPTRTSDELQRELDKHLEGTAEYEGLKAKLFVRKIFEKYGQNGVMTFEGFEHLLENLGLARLHIGDHDIHDHFQDNEFRNFHPDHSHIYDNETEEEEDSHKGEGHTHDHDHDHSEHEHHDGHDDHHGDETDSGVDTATEPQTSTVTQSHPATTSTDSPVIPEQTPPIAPRRPPKFNKVRNKKRRRKKKKKNDGRIRNFHNRSSTTAATNSEPGLFPVPVNSSVVNNRFGNKTSTGDQSDSPPAHRVRRYVDVETEKKCLSANEILQTFKIRYSQGITEDNFMHLCPAMLYQIDVHACHSAQACPPDFHNDLHVHCHKFHPGHDHAGDHNGTIAVKKGGWNFWNIPKRVWGFAALAVTVISLVGLLGVAVVPVMQKVFYNQLLHFLVALAVGSLSGDALLHLLPHALTGGHAHQADGGESHDHPAEHGGHNRHQEAVWKGMTALVGIYLFFIFERLLLMFSDWKRKRRKRVHKNLPGFHHTVDAELVGERLSEHSKHLSSCEEFLMVTHSSSTESKKTVDTTEEEFKELTPCGEEDDSREFSHGHSHDHGHGHGHGHSHMDKMPQTVASIAWMVIMGDGLHNFSDGLAIGAAFADSITGGLSTSVAVFCHELPHELGDFALLLRAGMTVKQALTYNIVSSVLCYMGMFIGVAVGNISAASQWIFCVAAGMFIYIALVDMLPEITNSSTEGENKCCSLIGQIFGISVGVSIMLVIALFEDKIKVSVGD